VIAAYWNGVTPSQVTDERNGFAHFLNPTNSSNGSTNYISDLAVQVPYTPTVNIYEYTTWQANDPLVHYLQSDLNYLWLRSRCQFGVQTGIHQTSVNAGGLALLPDIGKVMFVTSLGQESSVRRAGISQATYDENPSNLKFKDPLVKQSGPGIFRPTNSRRSAGLASASRHPVAECLLKGAQHSIRNKSCQPGFGQCRHKHLGNLDG